MLNYKIYTLDDTLEYMEIDSLEINNKKYVLLSETSNPDNICIRKIINNDCNNLFYRLDNFEFEDVFNQFIMKNANLFE